MPAKHQKCVVSNWYWVAGSCAKRNFRELYGIVTFSDAKTYQRGRHFEPPEQIEQFLRHLYTDLCKDFCTVAYLRSLSNVKYYDATFLSIYF